MPYSACHYDSNPSGDKVAPISGCRKGWFRMVDRLTSMAAFVKTVECGSFAAAATALGMTPQMTGRHVAELEARIGTRLLNRTTRRQSLTEAGEAFYERCR